MRSPLATVRKRGDRWQVQVRRKGHCLLSQSFLHRKDALAWARSTELEIDRCSLPSDRRVLDRTTLKELVERYRDTVTARKRRGDIGRIVLEAFLRHSIYSKTLSELRTTDFAAYRDERLAQVKPTTLKRQLGAIRHMFRVARDEWDIPIPESLLDRLKLDAPDQRRERRLRQGELGAIIEAARTCRNKLILPVVLLAIETGMRRSEILGIHREHVDLDRHADDPRYQDRPQKDDPAFRQGCGLATALCRHQGEAV